MADNIYYYIIVDESLKNVVAALLYSILTQFFLELNGRQYSGMLHQMAYEFKSMLMVDVTQLTEQDKRKLSGLFRELNEIKIKQKQAKFKLDEVSSRTTKAMGLFEQESKDEYEKLKIEEKRVTSEIDEIVYDFLGLSNKDRLSIGTSLLYLREARKLTTRGLKIEEEDQG